MMFRATSQILELMSWLRTAYRARRTAWNRRTGGQSATTRELALAKRAAGGPPTYGEVQHAVLQHEVVGPLHVLPLLRTGVVDAGVGEAARQVGAGQRLRGHLGDGGGVTQLLHVLREEVGVAHVEGRHGCVERRHGDGGDLRSDWDRRGRRIVTTGSG